MELNWSTFLLEILNFLVLVWILKRFFYRPVQELVARRRERIRRDLQAAQQAQQAAEAVQRQYRERLADWERERQAAHGELQRELEAARRQRLQELDAQLAGQREKARVVAERERREAEHALEARAVTLGAAFAGRLLRRTAGPELEQRLVTLALEDLAALGPQRRQALQQALRDPAVQAEVASAYGLAAGQRRALEAALAGLAGRPVGCRYRQEPELIAGLWLRLDSQVVHANLRDELAGFAQAGHG